VVGIVVDGVSDVITLKPEQIKPAPEFGSSLDTKYLLGLGTVEERMIILVDIERLMTSRDMELIEAAEAGA
jgi:purine-binding chemotaxis protein CheW